jgi:hypothetical protein
MHFRCNISLLLVRMETRRHVEFTGVELAGGVELAALVEKAVVGHFCAEGGWEAWWRERRAGEEGSQERAVEREAQWREGEREAPWRWRRDAAERGYGLMALR